MIPQRVSCEHVPEASDTDSDLHNPTAQPVQNAYPP